MLSLFTPRAKLAPNGQKDLRARPALVNDRASSGVKDIPGNADRKQRTSAGSPQQCPGTGDRGEATNALTIHRAQQPWNQQATE